MRLLARRDERLLERRARDLRTWASSVQGAMRIGAMEEGFCRVAGVIRSVTLCPLNDEFPITLRISDGSGQALVRWPEWRSAPKAPGVAIIVEGEARRRSDGLLVFTKPHLDLIPGPEKP